MKKKLIVVNSIFGLMYVLLLFGHLRTTIVVSDGISEKIRGKLSIYGVDLIYIPSPRNKLDLFTYLTKYYIMKPFIKRMYDKFIGHDHFFLSNLLLKDYILIEDGYGNYTNVGPNRSKLYDCIYRKWVKLGRSENCRKIILTGRSSVPLDIEGKSIIVPLNRFRNPIFLRRVSLLKEVFSIEDFSVNNIGCVLYTQPLFQDGFISVNEQIGLYTKIVRFLLENMTSTQILIIKPHPRDNTEYDKVFKHNECVSILDKDIPSECLDLLIPKFNSLSSASLFSSSGIGKANHKFLASKFLTHKQIEDMNVPKEIL